MVYYNENALKKALSLFKECLIYKGDKEITYGSYINLGMIYGVFKNYISSNIYLNKAYEISLSEKKLRQWLPFF
ncbi:tetratricopeptide repeat protein [Tenacibaculum soleae]|uniref:tetratricopeptide repeat protein n=1 Tax=Tenacibaculum soleae TaxID=447689 RepID=UPI003AB56A7F